MSQAEQKLASSLSRYLKGRTFGVPLLGSANGTTPPLGTVGIVHRGEVSAETYRSSMGLIEPGGLRLHDVEGTSIAWQRNRVVQALEGGWLLFFDSDQEFQPDALMRLLSWRVPIVSALIAGRRSPFLPCFTSHGKQPDWRDIPNDGLLEVELVGCGFLLIRREVFEQIEPPWFRMGQLNPEMPGEDSWFSAQAAKAKIPMFVDCGLRVGHVLKGVVYPLPGRGVQITIPGQHPCVIDVNMSQDKEEESDGRSES